MDKNLMDQIKANVEDMKRFRPTLREQVKELLQEIVGEFEDADMEMTFSYKGKTFQICEIEYGFNPGNNANNYSWEFVEKESEGCKKGFYENYAGCQWVELMDDFENEDIIFLANHIEGILEQINLKLDSSNKCLKPLIAKMDRTLNALKSEENTMEEK